MPYRTPAKVIPTKEIEKDQVWILPEKNIMIRVVRTDIERVFYHCKTFSGHFSDVITWSLDRKMFKQIYVRVS